MSGKRASRLECASVVTQVTVYARGAEVTRSVSVPTSSGEGPLTLVVGGLPPAIDLGTVRAEVAGGRAISGVATKVVYPTSKELPGSIPRRLRALEVEAEAAREEAESLAVRLRELPTSLSLAGRPDARSFSIGDRISDALAGDEILEEIRAELTEGTNAARERERVAREEAARLQLELAQSSQQASMGDGHPRVAVTIRVAPGEAALGEVLIRYSVMSARWWPTYVLRLDERGEGGLGVELDVGAYVANASGESWEGVELAVASADLSREVEIPKLRSLRYGRQQPPPPARGYRPLPADLDDLFAGYDTAAKASSPGGAPARRTTLTRAVVREEWTAMDSAKDDWMDDAFAEAEEESVTMSLGTGSMAPPQAQPAPMPSGPPASAPSGGAMMYSAGPPPPLEAPMAKKRGGVARMAAALVAAPAAAAYGAAQSLGGGGAVEGSATEHVQGATLVPAPPTDDWLDFDRLVLAATGAKRGQLQLRPNPPQSSTRELQVPPGGRDPRGQRGEYDYVYRCRGQVDVPDDAMCHRISLMRAEGLGRQRFSTVPLEEPSVFRVASFENPTEAPLLAGPVDVFLGGRLITQTELSTVDRGGEIEIGLGVEERLRVARNVASDEFSTGMLRGGIAVDHDVTIELRSGLGFDAQIWIYDRVPVTDDPDLEIELRNARPEPREYDQREKGEPLRGGLEFELTVPKAQTASVEFSYRLAMSNKREVVGGNRRE